MSSTITKPPAVHQDQLQLDNIHPSNEASSSRATISIEDNAIGDDEVPLHAVEALPDGGYGWTVVAACSLLTFWVNGWITAWGVLQTAILKSSTIEVDVRTITFVGSLAMACVVAFGMLSVRLIRTVGIRSAAVTSVILYGLGPILASFTLSNLGGLFCTAGIFMGLSSSIFFTATNTLPLQWFGSKLGTANGLIKTGGGIGGTVIPMAAQAMVNAVGLQWTFRIFGFLILTTGIPAAYVLQERGPAASLSRFDWSQLKNTSFMALSIGGAIAVFALYVPPFFLPLFASSIGLAPSTGAALVAGFGASTALGRLFCGWMCDYIGSFNALSVSVLMNTVSMLAIWPVSASLPPLLIFAIVNGLANGSFFVALPTAIAAVAPGSAASSISLAVSFWTPGYLLGSPIAGMLIQATGANKASSIEPYRAAIFYAAGTGVLSTLLVIYSRLRLEKNILKKF